MRPNPTHDELADAVNRSHNDTRDALADVGYEYADAMDLVDEVDRWTGVAGAALSTVRGTALIHVRFATRRVCESIVRDRLDDEGFTVAIDDTDRDRDAGVYVRLPPACPGCGGAAKYDRDVATNTHPRATDPGYAPVWECRSCGATWVA